MKSIDCCQYCVAPKRHPGCWGHCKDYKKAKAAIEQEKALILKAKKREDMIQGVLSRSKD